MTKQIINIGSADKGNGDPLRTAFSKVNDNFTELYTALGLDAGGLNIGSFEFTDNILSTTDSSNIIIDQAVVINSELTVHGDIVPNIGSEHNLGSLEKPFKSIYVSGQTVYFNGIPLSVDDNGEISVNNNRLVQDNGNYISLNLNVNDVQIGDIQVGDTLQWAGGFWVNGPNGGGGSIAVGDGQGPSVENVTEILINGTITEIEPGLVGISISGGTIQPYLELTNSPFIFQPVVLGSPVTVSTPGDGSGAEVEIVIDAGPVITSVTVTTPGTNYIVGQRYRVQYWEIGGNNDDSHIEFEVATVSSGGLLTVTDAAFTGAAAANTPGTYSNLGMQLRASPGDSIGPGLTLVRSYHRALFNIEAETQYDTNNDTSPLGTEWNSEGWGDLTGFNTRTYTTFYEALNRAVGNNIIGAELIMHDTINDQYYKFSFSNWGGNNGGSYAYTRTLIERDPNYFKKENYATANNIDVIEDDSTLQIGITRGNNNGIYNPFTEEGWDENVSPQGTLWNTDGWDDLTDIETRIYTNFYAAYNGGLGNRVPGSKAVMYVPSIGKYYAIQWLSWTQNNQGGGFSYLRYEIDLTKLNEGVKFPDGTVLKTAEGIGRVKLTAPGNRRIEEASGYKSVSVTSRNRTEITGATYTSVNAYELRVKKTTEINAFISPYYNTGTVAVWYISFDNVTFRAATINSDGGDNWMFYYVNANNPTLQVEDAPFYIRRDVGGEPVVWWNEDDLPGGSANFRGAVIDYHAYTGEATIIGTIHIVDDNDEEHITHTEVASGSDDSENDDLWLVQNEGTISYRRIDGESKTLRIQWTAKVFYGSEYYD